jgi:hypothetical protein
MKKLRAVVRLLEARLDPATRRRILEGIRSSKNAFGQNRDAVVLRRLSKRLEADSPNGPAIRLRSVSGVSDDDRPPTDEVIGRVRLGLERLRAEIAGLDLADLTSKQVAKAYVHGYRACRRAMRRCRRKPVAENFHAWRKPVKELYYLSLVFHRDESARGRIRPTRQLGQALGREHDLQVLKSRLASPSRRHWKAAIHKRLHRLHRDLFKSGAKLFRKRDPRG